MRDGEMDRELADALRDQRDSFTEALEEMRRETREGFIRLEGRMDGAVAAMHGHALEDARNFATQEQKIESAHKRIDTHLEIHREERQGRASLWVGVILAGASAAFAFLFSLFGRRSSS